MPERGYAVRWISWHWFDFSSVHCATHGTIFHLKDEACYMRDEDRKKLSEPYQTERLGIDRRFHSAIGADVPNAGVLVREIYSDLSRATMGVSWWDAVPIHERALISDYLYQCAFGIEVNLAEAKL